MQVVDWEGGEELDEEFRQGDCVEVDLPSDDDVPVDSDDDGEGEVGIIDEKDIYSDEECGPDDALACVSHKESVLSVALCPTDRRVLLTGGQDDEAILWSIQEQMGGGVKCVERCKLLGHTDSVIQVAFSNDGMYAATGSYDGTVKIWNPSSGSLVHTLEGPSKEIEWILWHPKGHAILAGSADTMAWMWWAPTGKVMQIFAGHAQSVNCGCWALGGKVFVTGSEDRSVIVWNPRAGAPQHHARQVHEGAIITICAHPESPVVVTGCQDGGSKVIQIETGKVLANLAGHIDSVESVAFSNAVVGGLLLVATAGMDGKIMVWDGKTFDLRCTLKEHFERGGVVKFKWLPAPNYGGWLCTCSTDNTLRLFNAMSGECLRTLHGHTDTVLDLDISLAEAHAAPSLVVVSGSEDKTCRLFVVALWTAGQQQGPSSVAADAIRAAPGVAPAQASSSGAAVVGRSLPTDSSEQPV